MENAQLRLERDIKLLGRSVRRLAKGYENDPPEIRGVRAWFPLWFQQLEEALPELRRVLTMHGGNE